MPLTYDALRVVVLALDDAIWAADDNSPILENVADSFVDDLAAREAVIDSCHDYLLD